MVRICAWCKLIMGEKEPIEDKSLTHGICEVCAEEMRQLRIKRKLERGEQMSNPITKWYIGASKQKDTRPAMKAFSSSVKPTKVTHPQFDVVIGPFKSYAETVDYAQKGRQETIDEVAKEIKNNPVNSLNEIIDEIITKQVLSTSPAKLTYNDIKWLELDAEAKKKYELRWRVSIPALKEIVKMSMNNPKAMWYIGLDTAGESRVFISRKTPTKKDYPQYVRLIGPFSSYRDIVNYIQEKDNNDNPKRKTIRPSRAKYCSERLVSPTKFDPRSFRTKVIRAHRLTLGCPKGQWDAKNSVCRVPMEVQRILHPVGEAKCPVPGREIGKNPAELATKIDDDIEFTAVELYLQGHGVDDVRILLQQEFGIDRIEAEYYAKRAGRITRGQVINMSTKTARLLR